MPNQFTVPKNHKTHFLSYVEMITESGCWIWTGAIHRQGYGWFCGLSKTYPKFVNHGGQILAHRASWLIFRGIIPEKMQVLHHCDTPSCVNPYHLFLGDVTANLKDCYKKNRRSAIGSQNGCSKLTEYDVVLIRQSYLSNVELAEKYNVSTTVIQRARQKINWKHVA